MTGTATRDRRELLAGLRRPSWSARLTDRGPQSMHARHYHTLFVFSAGTTLLMTVLLKSTYNRSLVNLWLVYSIVAVGFYLIFGLSGQFAFCQALFFGLGAYTSAWAVAETGHFLVGLLLAPVVTGGVAALFLALVREAVSWYLAVASLGLSEIGLRVLRNWEGFAGPGGTVVRIDPPVIAGIRFDDQLRVFALMMICLVAVLIVTIFVERSIVRREALALAENETVAAANGVPTFRLRLSLFVLGSAMAGVAGSLFAHWQRTLGTASFGVEMALGVFFMLVLGGMQSLWGPVIGAAFYVFVPEHLSSLSRYQALFYGSLLIVVITLFPSGLIGIVRAVRRLVVAPRRSGGHHRRRPKRAALETTGGEP